MIVDVRAWVFYSDPPDQELRVSQNDDIKIRPKNAGKRWKMGGKSEHRLFSKIDADGRGGSGGWGAPTWAPKIFKMCFMNPFFSPLWLHVPCPRGTIDAAGRGGW